MPIQTEGFDELANDLLKMAGAVGNEGHVIDEALKAGAVPIDEQIQWTWVWYEEKSYADTD